MILVGRNKGNKIVEISFVLSSYTISSKNRARRGGNFPNACSPHHDFTTISHFLPRGARRKYSHPHRDNPRDNPAHGAAGVAAAQTASGTPSYRDNLSPAQSFASPRPHARHARHEPKPKSISRLGVLGGLTPSTSNEFIGCWAVLGHHTEIS